LHALLGGKATTDVTPLRHRETIGHSMARPDGWAGHFKYWYSRQRRDSGEEHRQVPVSTYLLTRRNSHRLPLIAQGQWSSPDAWDRSGGRVASEQGRTRDLRRAPVMFPSGMGQVRPDRPEVRLPSMLRKAKKAGKSPRLKTGSSWRRQPRCVRVNGVTRVDWRRSRPGPDPGRGDRLQLHSNMVPQ